MTTDGEQRWRDLWEEHGVYRYDPERGRDETFVVDTPPPTVSGSLHVGHVFSFTHTDLIVRYQRMRGKNIFYPMGWDDNGLPSERRVQSVFNVRCDPTLPPDPTLALEWGREGETLSVSRPDFISLCARVVAEDERQFKELFRRIGLSVDWSHTYATIDDRSRYVSQHSFLRLLERNLVELRDAPTMWDVDFQTAVAQAEIEDRERDGAYYRILFDTASGRVPIATTRPELLPACIAVVAHPDDDRYKSLFGGHAITPLFRARVPVIADEAADPERGTGILMVCTFGDAADVDRWRSLGVPAREVIGRDGRMKPAAWGEDPWRSDDAESARRYHDKVAGLTVNQARREIAEMLREAGHIDGEPEHVRRPVKFFEKGDRPLEFVVSRQWFIPVMDRKEDLIEQGRKVSWRPDMFRKRYEDWVHGLNQDWCISRQRYFGVPIPVWFGVDEAGEVDYSHVITPRKEDLPVDPSADAPPDYSTSQRGRPGGFVGDPDVFDTWATSSLTPRIPTGWPDDEVMHERLYPNDLRPQAHDIIRTWAFTTITRSYLEDGSIPWHNVAISGWILDPDRKKMSKSKGNVVVPTDLLDEHGPDAMRYWSASARLGVDSAFDRNVLKEGRRLVTKIRNASRLVLGYDGESGEATHPLDRALLARLGRAVVDVTQRWDEWDHAGALELTEAWFWGDFCDNYLELSKTRAYAEDPSALGALRRALDTVLRLFAPFVPYVTEEIWNSSRAEFESIHASRWPEPNEIPGVDDDGCFDATVAVLTEVRRTKSEAKVSPKFPVRRLEVRGPAATLRALAGTADDIRSTANVEELVFLIEEGLELLHVDAALGEAPS